MKTVFALGIIVCFMNLNASLCAQSDSALSEQQYRKILEHNKKSAFANIGLATLSFQNGDYDQAAYFAQRCIDLHADYEQEAWLLLASALDLQKHSQKAINILEIASKKYSKNYLVWYNLAFLRYKNMEYEKVLIALDSSLVYEKGFQDSYLLKSIVLYEKENNPSAALWSMYGIMMNPNNDLSTQSYIFLWKHLNRKHKDLILFDYEQRQTIYNVGEILYKINSNDSQIELLKNIDPDKFLIDMELYMKQQIEKVSNDEKQFVSIFFKKLINSGHIAAFEYFILQSVNETRAIEWFKKNPEKTKEFANWLENN